MVNDLVAGPKKKWIEEVEALASEVYPQWRELFQETGKRLLPEKRKEIESCSAGEPERVKFVESILGWLGASVEPRTVAEIKKRLDSVLEFTIYVAREFLIGHYMLEKHESDVYDQFQLHYLAMDRFIIVSEDANLSKRTARSSQADRIMLFDRFLQSL